MIELAVDTIVDVEMPQIVDIAVVVVDMAVVDMVVDKVVDKVVDIVVEAELNVQ